MGLVDLNPGWTAPHIEVVGTCLTRDSDQSSQDPNIMTDLDQTDSKKTQQIRNALWMLR
jgi:hypothetical protein